MPEWHLLTGEYPPTPGGVADYTQLLAVHLAAGGHRVHVWAPGTDRVAFVEQEGVMIHRSLGHLGRRDLARAARELDAWPQPRRLLVQWVPHAFGYASMNVGFCLWIRARARQGDEIEIMVHESAHDFSLRSLRQSVAALVHRLMIVLLMSVTRQVWVSIPTWERRWRALRFGRRIGFAWLPVPSNIPVVDDPEAVARVRRERIVGRGRLIGHFGVHGRDEIALWRTMLPTLLDPGTDDRLLLIGGGSAALRAGLLATRPDLTERVVATGELPRKEVSHHLSASDVLLQPYPDGVSARRGSVMAALAHGRPIVTSFGRLSEPLWKDGAVVLSPAGEGVAAALATRSLLDDREERERLSGAARALYDSRFSIRHVVRALTGTRPATVPE